MQIIGIVFGMITMGYIGDTIGRKWGSVMTVSIMSVGAILLTAINGVTEGGFVVRILQLVLSSCTCMHASQNMPSSLHSVSTSTFRSCTIQLHQFCD